MQTENEEIKEDSDTNNSDSQSHLYGHDTITKKWQEITTTDSLIKGLDNMDLILYVSRDYKRLGYVQGKDKSNLNAFKRALAKPLQTKTPKFAIHEIMQKDEFKPLFSKWIPKHPKEQQATLNEWEQAEE